MRCGWVPLCAALLLGAGTRAQDGGIAQGSEPRESSPCLDCHSDQGMEIDLASEEVLSLYVDDEALAKSVHATIECTECHTDLKGEESSHEERPFPTRREFAVNYSEQCKECHFQNYTKTLDSVHHALVSQGKLGAAVCTDCHGAHAIGPAAEPRSRISKMCATCHQEIAEEYLKSVHGSALLENENPDVPNCTDCHRAHDIVDPRAGEWLQNTPQMCGNCHSDARMMKKYGLSTKVLSTYLADFHGSTTLLDERKNVARPAVALCTDCHGVHDITRANAAGSKVIQANLVKTCQKCHPGATENFPAAWLRHYEPTWEKAPLVFAVTAFYRVLIPFMIGGLLLQIALHLWRVVVNR